MVFSVSPSAMNIKLKLDEDKISNYYIWDKDFRSPRNKNTCAFYAQVSLFGFFSKVFYYKYLIAKTGSRPTLAAILAARSGPGKSLSRASLRARAAFVLIE
jgi:hypothetical protein